MKMLKQTTKKRKERIFYMEVKNKIVKNPDFLIFKLN